MQKMDYSKLLARIKELGQTQKCIAETISMSEGQFCQKLSGKYPFKQTDIQKLCDCLGISIQEIGVYFFEPEVEKHQQQGAHVNETKR